MRANGADRIEEARYRCVPSFCLVGPKTMLIHFSMFFFIYDEFLQFVLVVDAHAMASP